MFKTILQKATYMQGVHSNNYKQAWTERNGIASAKSIIGHSRDGICRRPILSEEIWLKVAEVLINARDHGNNKDTFGIGYKAQLPRRTRDDKHVYSAIERHASLQNPLHDLQPSTTVSSCRRQTTVQPAQGTCHSGHHTTSWAQRRKSDLA